MQVQSNALAALEALDKDVAEEILSNGCVTGDRINGLCDGETGKWCAMMLMQCSPIVKLFHCYGLIPAFRVESGIRI